ncbi:MAG: glycosyltransferase family 4 protein [Halobacteriota archaeon]
MRIGYVVYGDLDRRSGGYLYDRELATRFESAGDEVRVISLPERSYLRSVGHNASGRLRRRLETAEVDLLLVDELCHPSLAALVHSVEMNYPLVAIVHHLRSDEPRSRVERELTRRLERRFLAGVDAAVYNSETTRRAVEGLVEPVPSVVAYPAGDRFGGPLSEARIVARAAEPPFRVVFVGTVTPRKRLDTLLRGLERVSSDWRLEVVGNLEADPAYTESIRTLVSELGLDERVSLLGRLSDDELADELTRSHLLAVPSGYEGFGIAYVEGMGFGLPAIASSAGGAHEVVSHRETGFLVDPDDPSDVADAVSLLSRNQSMLTRMSLAARRRYLDHPTWDDTADSVRSFLERVVDDYEDGSL